MSQLSLVALVLVTVGVLLAAAPAAAQPYRGSPNLEPGLVGRDDILLFEDFELADWESHWSQVSFPDNHDAVTDVVFDGARSLVFLVPAGAHYGGELSFDFADEGLAEPEEVYFRYYVHFDPTWHLASAGEIGKLPGFGGTYGVAGWGGRPSDGTNGWSARMMNWDTGPGNAVGFYTYHADMTGIYGTHMRWTPDLSRSQWYCIEAYVQMNTITDGVGNNDGVLRGWIDGVPAFEKTDLRFRDVDTLKVEEIWFNIYVGGSWTADIDMQLHFDNVVVARNPIGCYSGTPPPDDGGVPPDDGGVPPGDASPLSDGATTADGGSAVADGGGPTLDASGAADDAATAGDGDAAGNGGAGASALESGCGCRSTGAPALPLLAILGLLLLCSWRCGRHRRGPGGGG